MQVVQADGSWWRGLYIKHYSGMITTDKFFCEGVRKVKIFNDKK